MSMWLPSRFGAVTFEHPAWLLLVAALPLVVLVLRFSLADFSPRQLAVQAALRGLVLLGITAGLAGPAVVRPTRAVSAVALVDVSDSVSDAALEAARAATSTLLREARRRGLPPPRVVRFAARPEELAANADPAPGLARFQAPGGAATDPALAASLGAGLADATAIPRLLLISDGRATRGDLLAVAHDFRARGLPVFAMPLPDPDTGDASVAELNAPDDVRPRVPFKLEVRVLADRATAARVRVDVDRGVSIDDPERDVALPPGTTTLAFTARITEAGITTLRARVTAAPDRHPENDVGVLALATEREPRVLALEGTPRAAGSFARALAPERIVTDVRIAGRPLRESDFAGYDLIVLADVPRGALPDGTLAALDAFVRAGGGLIVSGGTQSFGPGGYAGTRLEALLPVHVDLPDKREDPTLALALVIDKSGSMSGPKMDLTKDAARATAEALPPFDQIAVVVFDTQAQAVVRLQRAANRQRILGDIARITAGGGTNILAGLREAVDELNPTRARKKHIILLSDGQSAYDEIPDLVDAAAAARITISAVGVGDGADQTLLKMIASRGGGRFYHTRDPASIPRIFSRETSELGGSAIVDKPTGIRVRKQTAALAGIPLESAPALGGYVTTRPRAQAELLFETGDGTPLLARWQVGLGQVMAWTSDLGARWGASLARWPGYDKLWAQLARAAMRRRAANHFPIRATRDADQVHLAIDAIAPDDQFLAGLRATVEVTAVAPGGAPPAPRTIRLAESAPGLYDAHFRPDLEAGALLFRAVLRDPQTGAPIADAAGHLTLPFAPELQPATDPAAGAALLAAVATASGGRVVRDATEVLDPGPEHRDTRRPLRTPILLVTLLVFLLDVAARRIRLPLGGRGR